MKLKSKLVIILGALCALMWLVSFALDVYSTKEKPVLVAHGLLALLWCAVCAFWIIRTLRIERQNKKPEEMKHGKR